VFYEKRVEIRWRDMDAFGHVNHSVYATYFEEVRDEWLVSLLGLERLWNFIVRRIAIDYRRQLSQYGDDYVIARCRLATIGRTSIVTQEQIVLPDGTVVADGEAVLVAFDEENGASRPLRDDERELFEAALDATG
jgi:acyl-CoA thioester hydrolase